MESTVSTGPPKHRSRWSVWAHVRMLDGVRKGRDGYVDGYDPDGYPVVVFADGEQLSCPDHVLGAVLDEPTIADVAAGVVAWQQTDPQLRRASIQLTGHVVEAWVTIIPDLAARRVKFMMPYSADQVRVMLDDLAYGPPDRVAVVDGIQSSDDLDPAILDGGD